jgi:hypothetical protein
VSDDSDLVCRDDTERPADVLANTDRNLNGIDFAEVDPADHRILRVSFLRSVPPGAYGLPGNLSKVTITGGTRIVGIRVTAIIRILDAQGNGILRITVDQGGDFSEYTLAIDTPELDPRLSRIVFSFMASCPVDFDCRQPLYCPPPVLPEPALDYLAKDYASFRRMLLDLLPQLNPGYTERNPSDLGIALIELLAYEGDHLSYFQDAVANEAFLDTLRQRISARRHARLIDYRMHDGRNAWTWIHVAVNAAAPLAQGSKVVTRITAPLLHRTAPPGPVMPDSDITADALAGDPALAGAAVFETTHGALLSPLNNRIFLHAWGNEECCLRPGAQEAYLYHLPPSGGPAVRPALQKGDFLLFEEVKGPLTGASADADPAHRQVVEIDEAPEATEDPLYRDTLSGEALQLWRVGDTPLPLLRVHWRRQDALTFPLCLSARQPDVGLIRNVSVARGNMILVDHGLTTRETLTQPEPVPADPPFRLPLTSGPLTMQCEPERLIYDSLTGRPASERRDLSCDVRQARPAVSLLVTYPNLSAPELWTPVPDLLESDAFDQKFVAEIDNTGRAVLRFGDGEYGREIAGATAFEAVYRIGSDRAGNVGAEALAHLALPGPALFVDFVRNPLPARGGVDAETIEEVRQRAPQAFRAEQFRAVTEADYAAAARKLPEVAGAVASFRWTGSWYTVFVGVDPRDPADLINDTRGRTRLSPALIKRVLAFLDRYRLSGYDLEIRPPTFVALELEIEVCAALGYFRTEVGRAVADALSSRILPDGRRGFFHPDHFTFGQPVYLSQIYAAVERVEGVGSAVVRVFRRFQQLDNGELASGVLPIGPWEIARLENDPNFMEHGVLRIIALGGKA